jgi:hypothetical protein
MNDSPPAALNRPMATPFKYLGILTGLMLVTAWLALADARRVRAMEDHVLPTALGDRAFHPAAELPVAMLSVPLARYRGQGLYPRTRAARSFNPARMLRVREPGGGYALTDNGVHALYRPAPEDVKNPADEPGEDGTDAGETWFLKVGDDPGQAGRGLFREVGAQKYR